MIPMILRNVARRISQLRRFVILRTRIVIWTWNQDSPTPTVEAKLNLVNNLLDKSNTRVDISCQRFEIYLASTSISLDTWIHKILSEINISIQIYVCISFIEHINPRFLQEIPKIFDLANFSIFRSIQILVLLTKEH